MRSLTCLGTAALAIGFVVGAVGAAFGAVQITTQPALTPAFDPAISDYVIRGPLTGPVQVSVTSDTPVSVAGQPAQSGTFKVAVTLAAGQEFSIAISPPAGTQYYVRGLPSDFPSWTTQRAGAPQAEFYVVAPTFATGFGRGSHYVILFDTRGVPIWWQSSANLPTDAKLVQSGSVRDVLWTDRGGTNPGSEEHDLAGHVVQTVHAVGAGYSSDMHEVQFLGNFPDGPHYLLIGRYRRCCYNLTAHRGPASATIWDAVVQEVTPGGALVWSWDAADHVDPLQEADPQWWSTIIAGRSPYDVFHMNSAAIVDSASLLVSLRFADAIYKIRYKTAVGDRAIAWKLGGSPRAESLKLTDPHLGVGFGGQHYARTFSDPSDPAGAYVTLHDNGTGRGRAPRAVRYRIDESAKTATWTEQVTDAAVRAASCCGSARKLPQGDWVMSWGANPLVTELTPSGSRVFGITFSGAYSYRVDAILPGVLTRAALRSAMDSQIGAVAASAAAAADAAAADVAGAGDGDPEAPSADADDSSLPTDVQRGTPDPLETRVAYGPNPTSGALTFGYALARGGMVRIGIYDVAGRLRAELVRAFQPPGRYEVRWDARSLRESVPEAGVYFCRMSVDGDPIGGGRLTIVR